MDAQIRKIGILYSMETFAIKKFKSPHLSVLLKQDLHREDVQ